MSSAIITGPSCHGTTRRLTIAVIVGPSVLVGGAAGAVAAHYL